MVFILVREFFSCLFPSCVKLAWKTATLLALITSKYWSDLSLLHVDNQHLFHQHHAEIVVHASGGEMDQSGHLPPQIHTKSHCNVNFCAVFYLKAYSCHTEPFRKKSYGSQVSSLFQGSNRQHSFDSWGLLASILLAGDWARVYTLARHYFSMYIITNDWHQDSMQCAVLGPIE